jgi:hypothetical protein
VAFERANGVQRAGGLEAAGRAEPGREQQAIAFDHADEQRTHQARLSGCANKSSNSARTACFSAAELALGNCAGANAARKRTKCTAAGNGGCRLPATA